MTLTDTTTTNFPPVPAAELDRIEGGTVSEIRGLPNQMLAPSAANAPLPPQPFTDLFAKYHIG